MNKLLPFLFLSVSLNAQISDLTVDSVYFANTLDIIHRTLSEEDTICNQEYGYHVGDNELIVFGLRTINMGQHDAAFPSVVDSNGNLLPDSILDSLGVHWNPCHWHIHTEEGYTVSILNKCKELIETDSAKIGFNFQDMGNIMTYLSSSYGHQLDLWLNEYGTPDYALAVHPPNDNFNGDTRMGISAGYFDDYGSSTWGNSKHIESIPNGTYYLRVKHNFGFYFNQGLNIFPDSFDVSISISGTDVNRVLSVGVPVEPCCDASNPAPQIGRAHV